MIKYKAGTTHHPEDEIVKNVLRNSTIVKRSKGAVFTLIAAKTCVIGCCIHLNIICQVNLWNEKTEIKISLFLIPGNNSVFKFEKQSWSFELCGLYSTIWFLCMKTAVCKVFALVRQFLHFCKFTFCNKVQNKLFPVIFSIMKQIFLLNWKSISTF